MTPLAYSSGFREHAFVWALLLSISVHTLLALRLPNIHFEKPPLPEMLTVEIAPPPKAAPVITTQPTPPAPAPKPEAVKPKPLPAAKLHPVPAEQPEPAHNSAPIPAKEPPAPPAVLSAAPKTEAPPVISVPPPPPEPPKGPSQQDMDAARNQYGNLLAREIAKHKQYPRIAQMRGWQGETKVELQIDSGGNVLDSKIQESSGHEVLDKQALEMVKKAAPFPTPPEALQGRSFNILVPVSFHLE